jgi:hypothetical protein
LSHCAHLHRVVVLVNFFKPLHSSSSRCRDCHLHCAVTIFIFFEPSRSSSSRRLDLHLFIAHLCAYLSFDSCEFQYFTNCSYLYQSYSCCTNVPCQFLHK